MNRLTITIPNKDNEGNSLFQLHQHAREFMVKTYGGFSSVQVHGQWQDPEDLKIYVDNSTRYEVLVDDSIESLYPLAMQVKSEGKQKCVLLTSEETVIQCQ